MVALLQKLVVLLHRMATQGKPAFDLESHRRLHRLRSSGNTPLQLAVQFGVSLPTIARYLAIEPGSADAPYMRPESASTNERGLATTAEPQIATGLATNTSHQSGASATGSATPSQTP
jgi:hypothetical protein